MHPQVPFASVVQWIEWQIPVLLIWVRFPSGVLLNGSKHRFCPFFVSHPFVLSARLSLDTSLLRYSTLSRSVTRSDSMMRTISITHMRKCSSVAALLLLLSVLLCRGRSRSDGRNHHCRFCWYGLCEKWSLLLYNPDQNRNHPLMTNLVSWSVSLSSTQQ